MEMTIKTFGLLDNFEHDSSVNVNGIIFKFLLYLIKLTDFIMKNLEKDESINLTKAFPALNNIRVGLSWDDFSWVHLNNGQSTDADASVFMLDENGKIPNEGYFVFYNNLISTDGSVKHNGDAREDSGNDIESVDICLSEVSTKIQKILIAITIDNRDKGFDFENTTNSSIRLYNLDTNEGICEFQLFETFPDSDAIIMGGFYRSGSEWKFEVMVRVFNGGLQALLDEYSN
jgi:tellurium resistance protein TerD